MTRKSIQCVLLILAGSHLGNTAFGADSLQATEDTLAATEVAHAVTTGLRILERGTLDYREHAKCFTCHHQTLPMLAQATARKNGFAINEDLFRQQTEITHDGFKNRHDKLRAGTGIGGQSMTVGYALWALDIANWKPDDTTEAMVAYLLKTQHEDGRFYISKTRPPLEDSPATSVTIAAYYLQKFATEAQDTEVKASVTKARQWLLDFTPERQEDRNARLWGLQLLDADAEEIAKARQAVLLSQREDGGWSQLPDMTSDSYATGQSLWMLHETGLSTSDPAYQRGAQFLLNTQLKDGSWRIRTRSKPIQTYFESGFPHGVDQFISICGTSWAVAALALTSTVEDLVTPTMTDEDPAAGKRVRQVAPEYAGTEVYHSLYLPTDWKPGGKYPVIVEYTGNQFPAGNGSGEVKDANLGYGMSGGRGFIWVAMPYVEVGRKMNAVKWWGDKQATVDYCKVNLPRICEAFGGDPDNVFVCGFSRGAIGSSYIGLADDEIAALWKGVFTHDHFDGQKNWGYPESDRASALKRLARLSGRPVLVCGVRASMVRDGYLADHLGLAEFTFLDVPTTEIFDIPEGPYLHSHTDLWMHRESSFRRRARAWLQRVLEE